MSLQNFKRNILEATGGEAIEAVVIGVCEKYDNDPYAYTADIDTIPQSVKNKVMSWIDAEKYLNYEYNAGFGGLGCHAIYVWTPQRIIFVSTYDGATKVCSVPRHPVDGEPIMPGGG